VVVIVRCSVMQCLKRKGCGPPNIINIYTIINIYNITNICNIINIYKDFCSANKSLRIVLQCFVACCSVLQYVAVFEEEGMRTTKYHQYLQRPLFGK